MLRMRSSEREGAASFMDQQIQSFDSSPDIDQNYNQYPMEAYRNCINSELPTNRLMRITDFKVFKYKTNE